MNSTIEEDQKVVQGAENLIFTPDSEMTQQELIQVMMSGVRKINVNLARGTNEENQKLVENLTSAVKVFRSEPKFNIEITKICSIRGRIPRTGRMRNDWQFMLSDCDKIVLTSDKRYENCSTNEVCYVTNFKRIISLLKPGDVIKIGSEIVVEVQKIALNSYVTCCVLESDCLDSFQKLKIPAIIDESLEPTEEELEDLEFAKQHQFDFIIAPSINRPEYYHKLKKLLKGSDIKIIAGIDAKVDDEKIDRIFEHFYGIFIESYSISDRIIDKARDCKKFVIVGYPKHKCAGYRLIKACEAADSLLLKSSEGFEVINEAAKQLTKIMKNMEQELTEVQGNNIANICINSALKMTKASKAKALVCITQNEKTARTIASSRPPFPVILITKSRKIAKRLQLWRDVNAMVYVDCEKKTWKGQRKEMMKIAAIFGKEMEIFEGKNLVVTCCNSESESDDIDSFEILESCEICK